MAEIHAFRAFRYDLGHVGPMSEVVAPPYDVIDAALQKQLYDRSPFNVVRVDYGMEHASDSPSDNRYTRAARTMHDWIDTGVIKQDSARSLYVCHQEFEVDGVRHVRKGFLARVKLEPFGIGRIYPHEQTMAGPKADRLSLFRATAMNLSPVFGLYPDDPGEVQTLLDETVRRSLPLSASDHLGTKTHLWPVSDQKVISRIAGLMGPRPVFIADGHHRYETSLRYLDEQKQAGLVHGDDAPQNFVLMMLVGMSDPGLLVLPTHRLIRGLPPMTGPELREKLASHFEIETIGSGDEAARQAWELIEADGSQNLLGFGTVIDGGWHLARLTRLEAMKELSGDHSEAWQSLAVSILHVLVLGKLLGGGTCQYVHRMDEVLESVHSRDCELAALVPPATMLDVEEIASQLETMPAKSTYFYPKLLTGMVFNSLKLH